MCLVKPGFSQVDSIIALPQDQQMLALLKWYYNDLLKRDSQQIVLQLSNAEKLFAVKSEKVLQQQAWLLIRVYKASHSFSAEKAAIAMLAAANEADKNNWPLTRAECWHHAGNYYFSEGTYNESMFVPAFEYMLKAQNVFDDYDPVKYRYLLLYSNGLANCYYRFGEYRE